MDPLHPTPALLCKLASVTVHADELLSQNGHDFDRHALDAVLNDPDVKEWIATMTKMGMAPVKRN